MAAAERQITTLDRNMDTSSRRMSRSWLSFSGSVGTGAGRVTAGFTSVGRAARGLGGILNTALKGTVILGFVAALAKIPGAAKAAIGNASDVGEALSKNERLFGDQAGTIDRFSRTTASAMGLARVESLQFAGSLGNVFRNVGFTTKAAAGMSTQLIGRAADIASFNNAAGGTPEVLQAIQSGLAGETEPLRRFGVFLTADAVQAEALASGVAKANVNIAQVRGAQLKAEGAQRAYNLAVKEHGVNSLQARTAQNALTLAQQGVTKSMRGQKVELTEAQKQQAIYNLVMKQSQFAAGDFARTSGGAANQQRILAAQTRELSTVIGRVLLPVWTQALRGANALVGGLLRLTNSVPAMARTFQQGFRQTFLLDPQALRTIAVIRTQLTGAFNSARTAVAQFGRAGQGGLSGFQRVALAAGRTTGSLLSGILNLSSRGAAGFQTIRTQAQRAADVLRVGLTNALNTARGVATRFGQSGRDGLNGFQRAAATARQATGLLLSGIRNLSSGGAVAFRAIRGQTQRTADTLRVGLTNALNLARAAGTRFGLSGRDGLTGYQRAAITARQVTGSLLSAIQNLSTRGVAGLRNVRTQAQGLPVALSRAQAAIQLFGARARAAVNIRANGILDLLVPTQAQITARSGPALAALRVFGNQARAAINQGTATAAARAPGLFDRLVQGARTLAARVMPLLRAAGGAISGFFTRNVLPILRGGQAAFGQFIRSVRPGLRDFAIGFQNLAPVARVAGSFLLGVGRGLVDTVWPAIKLGAAVLLPALSLAIQGAGATFRLLTGIVGGVFRRLEPFNPLIQRIGRVVGFVFGTVIINALTGGAGAIARIMPLVARLGARFPLLLRAATPVFQFFQSAFTRLVPWFPRLFNAARTATSGVARVLGFLFRTGSTIFSGLQRAIFGSIRFILGRFGLFQSGTTSAFNAVRTVVNAVGRFIPDFLRNRIGLATRAWSSGLTTIRSTASSILGGVQSIAQRVFGFIPTRLQQAGASAVNAARTQFNQVRTAILSPIQGAVRTIGGLPTVLYRTAVSVVNGFMDGVKSRARALIDSVRVNIVEAIPNFLKERFGIRSPSTLFQGFGSDMLLGFIGGIASQARALIDMVRTSVVEAVPNFLKERLPSTLFQGFGSDTIQGFIGGITSQATNLINSIKTTVTDALPNFVKNALGINSPSSLFQGFGSETIQGFIGGITSQATNLINNIKSTVTDTLPNFVRNALGLNSPNSIFQGFGSTMLQGFIGGITSQATNIINSIRNTVTDTIPNFLRQHLSPSLFQGFGSDVLVGFINGITSQAGNLINVIKTKVTDALPDFVVRALEIGSPSRLFFGYGSDTMAGFVQGIESQEARITKAVTRAVGGGIQAAQGATAQSYREYYRQFETDTVDPVEARIIQDFQNRVNRAMRADLTTAQQNSILGTDFLAIARRVGYDAIDESDQVMRVIRESFGGGFGQQSQDDIRGWGRTTTEVLRSIQQVTNPLRENIFQRMFGGGGTAAGGAVAQVGAITNALQTQAVAIRQVRDARSQEQAVIRQLDVNYNDYQTRVNAGQLRQRTIQQHLNELGSRHVAIARTLRLSATDEAYQVIPRLREVIRIRDASNQKEREAALAAAARSGTLRALIQTEGGLAGAIETVTQQLGGRVRRLTEEQRVALNYQAVKQAERTFYKTYSQEQIRTDPIVQRMRDKLVVANERLTPQMLRLGLATREGSQQWQVNNDKITRVLGTINGATRETKNLGTATGGLGIATKESAQQWQVNNDRITRVQGSISGATRETKNLGTATGGLGLATKDSSQQWQVNNDRINRALGTINGAARETKNLGTATGGLGLATKESSQQWLVNNDRIGRVLGSINGTTRETKNLGVATGGLGLATKESSQQWLVNNDRIGRVVGSINGATRETRNLGTATGGLGQVAKEGSLQWQVNNDRIGRVSGTINGATRETRNLETVTGGLTRQVGGGTLALQAQTTAVSQVRDARLREQTTIQQVQRTYTDYSQRIAAGQERQKTTQQQLNDLGTRYVGIARTLRLDAIDEANQIVPRLREVIRIRDASNQKEREAALAAAARSGTLRALIRNEGGLAGSIEAVTRQLGGRVQKLTEEQRVALNYLATQEAQRSFYRTFSQEQIRTDPVVRRIRDQLVVANERLTPQMLRLSLATREGSDQWQVNNDRINRVLGTINGATKETNNLGTATGGLVRELGGETRALSLQQDAAIRHLNARKQVQTFYRTHTSEQIQGNENLQRVSAGLERTYNSTIGTLQNLGLASQNTYGGTVVNRRQVEDLAKSVNSHAGAARIATTETQGFGVASSGIVRPSENAARAINQPLRGAVSGYIQDVTTAQTTTDTFGRNVVSDFTGLQQDVNPQTRTLHDVTIERFRGLQQESIRQMGELRRLSIQAANLLRDSLSRVFGETNQKTNAQFGELRTNVVSDFTGVQRDVNPQTRTLHDVTIERFRGLQRESVRQMGELRRLSVQTANLLRDALSKAFDETGQNTNRQFNTLKSNVTSQMDQTKRLTSAAAAGLGVALGGSWGAIAKASLTDWGGIKKNIVGASGGLARGTQNNVDAANKSVNSFTENFRGAANFLSQGLGAGLALPRAYNPSPIRRGGIEMLARGTRFWRGGPAIYGEAGQELVIHNGQAVLTQGPTLGNLPRGAQVVPARTTERILSTIAQLGGKLGGAALSGSAMNTLARRVGFRGQDLITALAVAFGESDWNPRAFNRNRNGSVDRGLWQINSIHGALSTFDPLGNARAAWQLSEHGRNWVPWVAYNNGRYRQFLDEATTAALGPHGRVPPLEAAEDAITDMAAINAAIARFNATLELAGAFRPSGNRLNANSRNNLVRLLNGTGPGAAGPAGPGLPGGLPLRNPSGTGLYDPGDPTFYAIPGGHRGYDLRDRNDNRTVYFPRSGVITRLDPIGMEVQSGNVRDLLWHIIRHPAGLRVGSTVRAGQRAGTYAEVGVSNTPHLHWERLIRGILQRTPGAYGLNRPGIALADGGLIREPIVGYGLRSGRSYSFGERDMEAVFNRSQLGALASALAGGGGPRVYVDSITVNVNGSDASGVREGARSGVTDAFRDLENMLAARGRRRD